MLCDLTSTVVVFDLDDTLYQEADYVESGVRHVCAQIQSLYGKNIYPDVKDAMDKYPEVDWLAYACEIVKLPSATKDSLLWMYRLHYPKIHLSNQCKVALKAISSTCKAVAVLTDGRSISQRFKLKALGIAEWPVYISEEYGAPKPSPDRFKAIQQDYPANHYIYVADNVQKDFLGCNPLGWISIGMKANERNVHSQSLNGIPESTLPAFWVNNWQDLTELLFNQTPRTA